MQVCGRADSRLAYLGDLLSVQLVPRGRQLLICSNNKKDIAQACHFFDKLQDHLQQCFTPSLAKNIQKHDATNSLLDDNGHWQELYKQIQMKNNKNGTPILEEANSGPLFVTTRGLNVQPRGERQATYVNSLLKNTVTFGIGPAGTGKTFLSIAIACSMLNCGQRSRLIITRPAVEAGESLGFLPGDLSQKVDPYLRPLYDALYECLGRDSVSDMLTNRQIEIAPLAYMRGRTLNDAVVLLDESQNCTLSQLKMFLTRLGRNSSMCLSGDATQIDLAPGKSGLALAASFLGKVDGVGVVYFQKNDIVRNPMVSKILAAFEEEENE